MYRRSARARRYQRFTAVMCIVDPISAATAPTLTGFSSGRSPIALFLGMAVLHSMMGRRRVRVTPIVIFPIGIVLADVATLKFAGAHWTIFLRG